jgi:cell wall-associated NlpC family hydrolase
VKALLIPAGLCVVALPAVLIGAATQALTGGSTAQAAGSAAGLLGQIPADYLALYEAAAGRCPGLPWTVLAAVGTVETDNGANTATSTAGAQGPMQFEPATWARWGIDGDGDGIANIDDPADAIPAAADYLCASGARDGADIPGALYAYNHSTAYVTQVLADAQQLDTDLAAASDSDDGDGGAEPGLDGVGGVDGTGAPVTGPAGAAVAFALSQVGVPYEWGGDGPADGEGFDCSGLTQAAWSAAGRSLPRTAQTQYEATAPVPVGAPLAPGDLLFFGTSLQAITHVGLYVGGGQMVDAPHTGADVRVEPYRWSDYLGATRPT